MQALARQGLLKGAETCKMDFCEHCIIGKKTNVKFDTVSHCTEGILDYVHTDVWGPTKTASIGGNHYFGRLLTIFLGDVGCTPCDTKEKS